MEARSRLTCSREQFPIKLYAILELADTHGRPGCSWLPHGRAFKIDDEHDFMRAWVPIFFKHTKIHSFHRQLYLWGFKKLPKIAGANAWCNDFFIRGAPEEMKKMIRIKIKGNAEQDYRNKKMDPHLCTMPPLPSDSKSPLRMDGNNVGSRRVSMEFELVSAGPVPARELFKCSASARLEELDIPLTENACAPLSIMSPSIAQMANTQSPITLNQEKQYPVQDCFRPLRADYEAPSSAVSSGDDEVKFGMTARIEPLTFQDEAMCPAENSVGIQTKPRLEPSSIHDGINLEEFSSYMDNMIRIL